MKVGVICKQKYCRDVRAVIPSDCGDEGPHSALEKEFSETLKLTLKVMESLLKWISNPDTASLRFPCAQAYLDYLKRWVCMGTPTSTQKNVLEMEWNFTRSVCSEIPNGEMLAGNAFSAIASSMISSTARCLRDGIAAPVDFCSDASDSESGDRSEGYVQHFF